MALGSDVKRQTKPEELEELLEGLEKLLERTKVLYEQYFMGIQKVAPMQMHRDIERKVRELTQQQIRNTGLRFRFTTISQKFGAYNTYWKRTLREIEQGKYVRDLARVQRKADRAGEELPEELLVKLPRLVQDRIRRDRARLAERASRDADEQAADDAAFEAMALAAELPPGSPVSEHQISEDEAKALFNEGDLDLDELFSAMTMPAIVLDDDESLSLTETPEPPRVASVPRAPAPRSAPAARTTPVPPAAATAPTAPVARTTPVPPAATTPSSPAATPVPPASPSSPAASRPAASIPPAHPAKTARTSVPIPVIGSKSGTPGETVAPRPAGQEASFRVPPPPGKGAAPPPVPGNQAPPIPGGQAGNSSPSPGPSRPPPSPPRLRTQPIAPLGPPPPPGMDEKQCRELYTRYLKARQLVGENNDDVTYEKLVSSLGKQAAAIMNQHGARGVEFHVVVRGDKVVLKAKPIKPDEK